MSPQWMRSSDGGTWHEIAPDTHRTGRCEAVVRGVVHQRRTVPMEGELCSVCLAWRGVIEIPSALTVVGSGTPAFAAPISWPEVDPDLLDQTGPLPLVAEGLAALGVPVAA